MASNTPNLNLYKKDPVADASDTFNLTTMLNNNWDKIDAASAADAYDPSGTYAVGEYCIHDNTLYKCTTAITTPEAWTVGHWEATTVAAELEGLSASLSSKVDKTPPTEYDLPIAAGIAAVESGCYYSKTQDGIVNLVMSCKKDTDGLVSDSIIATLPVDIRPAREVVANAFAATSGNVTYGCLIRIWPSGAVKIWMPIANVNQVGFQVSFVAGN